MSFPGSDGYSWYTPGDTLTEKRSKMDERRIQLMESLHGEDLAPGELLHTYMCVLYVCTLYHDNSTQATNDLGFA